MNVRALVAGLAALVCLPGAPARAQEVSFGAIGDGERHLAHASFGADDAFLAGVGYGHILRVADRPLIVSGTFTMPWATPDVHDYRLRAGATLPLAGEGSWKLAGRLGFASLGTRNDGARLTSLVADVGLRGGYFAERWLFALAFDVEWVMSTHVRHSQEYRQTRYADARDGWYASTGGNLVYGIVFGHSVGPVDLILRAGQGRDIRGVSQLLPFYATLGVNVRF